MHTIDTFKEVLNTFGKFVDFDNNIELEGESNDPDIGERKLSLSIYTDQHKYSINAIETKTGEGYLGCIASNRKPKAGENYTRGNDLADGPLSIDTWHQILGDIVSYELVPLFKPETTQTTNSETVCAQIK